MRPSPSALAAQAAGPTPPDAALRRSAARALAGAVLGLAVLAGLGASAASGSGLTGWFAGKALVVFGGAVVFMWLGLPAHAPHPRFGPANGITLGRLALVALLAAAVGEPVVNADAFGWAVLGVATVAASLDAVDGPIARRRHEASPFGARFDMETDALLVMVLSALALHLDKAGAWVLAAGAMRYVFVAAAWIWPWLAAPLPERYRRKVVCVVQIVSLILCLCPWLPQPLSAAVAAVGLAALTVSFLLDVVWLARHAQPQPESRA
ncbi:MAG: CDP-alcohol phosphatidyltransferase family protein [Comamonadaceae bacterium]|nr:MAG: CDP-alcohol phosphatidyltransferase family protein [Comamonadaceae bacterium]